MSDCTLTHANLTPESDVEWTKRLLRLPPGQWPKGFEGFPNVAEAFRQLLADAAANIPAPPEFTVPRGIVICGGGWRFYPSIYVTVRMIRHIGCRLPIQVWYLGDRGEFDPRMEQCLKDYGVGWINANAMWRDRPGMAIRRGNIDGANAGWALKPFAAAFSPFAEVICLDADCYPVYDPERFMAHPEFVRVGAAFWPDQSPLEPGQWERFGIPPQQCAGLESGQYIVDKRRHWAPLWLTCFINAYHDYVYRHVYGDKDTFNLAWRKLGHEMSVPTARPGWSVHSFVHGDYDGRTLFVHRTRDKFKLFGEIDGAKVPSNYMTEQRGGTKENIVNDALPLEAVAHGYAARCDELLRPEKHFDLHGSEHHLDTWRRVNMLNEEYRFGTYKATDTAIDIGAGIGAATHAMLTRGMGHVIAVEPFEKNVKALRKNLSVRWGERFRLYPAAVWHGSDRTVPLYSRGSGTGDGDETVPHSFGQGEATYVPATTLDTLILTHGKIRLLKVDAEGAEFPILYSSRYLNQIEEIVGEWHDQAVVPEHAAIPDAPDYNGAALAWYLTSRGFMVETWNETQGMGIFRARRKK